MPLGISQYNYDDIQVSLHSGDKLFFYTDGITEAMNKSEDEFGTERLLEVINKESATPDVIINAAQEFSSGKTQSDDITVVMIDAE